MAVLLSIPKYFPDPTSIETVAGYEVQSCAATNGFPVFTGIWNYISGSPFASNNNIVDTDPNALYGGTQYRARPIRHVVVNGVTITLNTPWSTPFTAGDFLYDALITRLILPNLRFTYMNDNGISQSNGTVVSENIGAGNGLWVLDGVTNRFQLQAVSDDDPIRVLDNAYKLIAKNANGVLLPLSPDVDYSVDNKSGIVEFAVPPVAGTYIRFDFNRADFVNADLLSGIRSAINALSQFGINGYEMHRENNLFTIKQSLNGDLIEIICKIAIYLMRQGATESSLRSSMAWRDGGIQEDPYPSRALQFLVQDLQLTEASIQMRANAYIRSQTHNTTQGEFEMMFVIDQQTPFNANVFSSMRQIVGTYGNSSFGTSAALAWWI